MTEADFLAEIKTDPYDWDRRLVFADWLEDSGDERAAVIRNAHQIMCKASSPQDRRNCQTRLARFIDDTIEERRAVAPVDHVALQQLADALLPFDPFVAPVFAEIATIWKSRNEELFVILDAIKARSTNVGPWRVRLGSGIWNHTTWPGSLYRTNWTTFDHERLDAERAFWDFAIDSTAEMYGKLMAPSIHVRAARVLTANRGAIRKHGLTSALIGVRRSSASIALRVRENTSLVTG